METEIDDEGGPDVPNDPVPESEPAPDDTEEGTK